MADYKGNFILGFNHWERSTITINAALAALGKLDYGTLINYNGTTYSVVRDTSDIGLDTVGIVLVQPEGIEVANGEQLDVVCGTVRIDTAAYEAVRLANTNSTLANLSDMVNENASITGNGCIIQLVKVVR